MFRLAVRPHASSRAVLGCQRLRRETVRHWDPTDVRLAVRPHPSSRAVLRCQRLRRQTSSPQGLISFSYTDQASGFKSSADQHSYLSLEPPFPNGHDSAADRRESQLNWNALDLNPRNQSQSRCLTRTTSRCVSIVTLYWADCRRCWAGAARSYMNGQCTTVEQKIIPKLRLLRKQFSVHVFKRFAMSIADPLSSNRFTAKRKGCAHRSDRDCTPSPTRSSVVNSTTGDNQTEQRNFVNGEKTRARNHFNAASWMETTSVIPQDSIAGPQPTSRASCVQLAWVSLISTSSSTNQQSHILSYSKQVIMANRKQVIPAIQH
ncbi:hypothetical protein RRG08_033955 [Elysia crispata]|uniref:Uncharacterized protein n=1 Tax=Elysia crispata TaxID=231223 RepID=A0AAE1D3B1_9GAST|nr:hypothetical protein RRG08_033955 [Elysia crispata]